MFTDTITLFNKYDGASGTTWFPHILHETKLIKDKAVILQKYGQDAQDKASLIINCNLEKMPSRLVILHINLLNNGKGRSMMTCQIP